MGRGFSPSGFHPAVPAWRNRFRTDESDSTRGRTTHGLGRGVPSGVGAGGAGRHHIPLMCGRYSNTLPPEAIRQVVKDLQGGLNFPPSYNAAPTQRLPVVVRGEAGPTLALMRWGLVPSWSDGRPKWSNINARAETVDSKPAFRDAFRRRRCLVPADGFYEWAAEGGGKQPYRFVMADRACALMAGLGSGGVREGSPAR